MRKTVRRFARLRKGAPQRVAGAKLRRVTMLIRRRLAGLALATGMAALPALAQEAAKKEPPKPAPSPSQALLEQWNDIGRKLIVIAEDLPEDKYDYKPNPDSRTFVAQLQGCPGTSYPPESLR
jgi:hypothetical protein